MRKVIFISVLFSFGFLFNSCKKDIEVPAYIHIPSAGFATSSGQGTDIQNIQFVGVYVDDNLEGIYELPITFPILKKGQKRVDIRAFVKRLARQGQVLYPMATTDSAFVTLEEGKTDTIKPTFTYVDNTKFVWLDDFNNGTKTIEKSQGTLDTILVTKSKGPGVDTSLYAYMTLGTVKNSSFVVITTDEFTLPFDRDVYLEFHYKSNINFTVGLISLSTGDILPSVTPFQTSGQWRKGYVYLNDEILNQPSGTKFKVFFGAANGDEAVVPEVYLDNLKLLYRE